MQTRAVAALLTGLLFTVGCSGTKEAPPIAERGPKFAGRGGTAALSATPGAGVRVGGAGARPMNASDLPETVSHPPVGGQKLIRNGVVTLDVDSVDSALAAIRSLVASLGGYVGGESQSVDEIFGPRATISCRVPAEKLDSMLERLKSAGRPSELTITTEDITEQYVDLEARLRNQRQLEARLAQLLARPGNNLADLLNAERELARVRYEIESLEGKQRLWDKQVALSTLTINLRGPRAALGASRGGFGRSLGHALSEAGENFVAFVAALVAAIGWLVPLIAVLWIAFLALRGLWRLRRRRREARTAAIASTRQP